MRNLKTSVFIATSIDGYITDKDDGLDWLHQIPNPNQDDMGYNNFIQRMDAILMGRKTFEAVLGFGIEWPYSIPVFVWSKQLKEVPADLHNQVSLVNGDIQTILESLENKGFSAVYVDGGSTIRSLLEQDLIDEMTLTTIPVLLGGGNRLFTNLPTAITFSCVESKHCIGQISQARYLRLR